MTDHRLFAPATLRNRNVILDVLRGILPKTGTVLEVASGSGEHIVHFAQHLPALHFQPSDLSPRALHSVSAWITATGVTNVRRPIILDAATPTWPIASADAIVCINMVHISNWRATVGLLNGASIVLPQGSPLYLYGPYRRTGIPTAPSNEEFDRALRNSEPGWGIRDLEAVAALAREAGFAGPAIKTMPANNLSIIFHRM